MICVHRLSLIEEKIFSLQNTLMAFSLGPESVGSQVTHVIKSLLSAVVYLVDVSCFYRFLLENIENQCYLIEQFQSIIDDIDNR